MGPIDPAFRQSRVARHLASRTPYYRCAGVTRMAFWARFRPIVVWKPADAPGASACPAEARTIAAAEPSAR